MEIVLYIAGAVACLALTYFLITLTATVRTLDKVLLDSQVMIAEARQDVQRVMGTVDQLKSQIMPIMSNVNDITFKVNTITDGVQKQMVNVHATVEDTLDVVRGTIDDVERIKNELVGTVEAPVKLVRTSMQGSVGAIMGAVGLIKKLMGGGNSTTSANGASRTRPSNNSNGTDGSVRVENFRARSNGHTVEEEYHVDVFSKG
jgi:uncharacterized protein YoxC